MNMKKLFNIIFLCGIFLWIIPSASFTNVDKKLVIFYTGFNLIISVLYLLEFLKVIKNKRNMLYESILVYLSFVGSLVAHVVTYVILLVYGYESNFVIIPWVLILRGLVAFSVFLFQHIYYEDGSLVKETDNDEEIFEDNVKFVELEDDIKTDSEIKIKKNNKWVYKILLRDFKAHIKNYIVFIISAVLTVTYVYGFLGNLFVVHSIQQTHTLNLGEGITVVVLNALVVITIVNILIQFYALKNYIQNRMNDFKTLVLLGMKKREIYKSMGFILGISLFISYFIGAILGNIMIIIFRKVYSIYLENLIIPMPNIIMITIISFVLCVLVLGFIMAIVQEMAIETSMLNISNSDMEEKTPKANKLFLLLPITIIFLLLLYSDPHRAESIYIIYPWILVAMVTIYYGAGYIIRKIKSKRTHYLNNILTYNLIMYKPKSYLKNSLVLYSLIFVMFLTYIFQIATLFPLDTEGLYPYDYICLAYDKDKSELENLEEKFDVDSKLYEVLRATVPGGEDGGYGYHYKTLPIGHHLGISESTYKELTGETLNLKNKDIYILYQEDKSNKAHPLDFYVKRSKPSIRIGEPRLYGPGERKIIFDFDYNLVGEKREILLGRLSNIMYENIVVFSDEYFSNEHKNTDGIKWLMTVNSNTNNDEKLDAYFDNYLETHNDEKIVDGHVQSVYIGKDLEEAFQGEKIFTLIINISVLITFAIASIIIVFVHVFGNIDYYKNRYELLGFLGEKKKKSDSIIKKEVRTFVTVPCALAILTSLVFIIMNISMRGFNYVEIVTCSKVYIIITLVFLILLSISTFTISRLLIKQIGGK